MIDHAYAENALANLHRRGLGYQGSYEVRIDPGLSPEELMQVEGFYGFVFPPDLRLLLEVGLPVTQDPRDFPNWRHDPGPAIKASLESPFTDLWATIRDRPYAWLPEWGQRPDSNAGALALAQSILGNLSRMIPIYGHRYIPSQPSEEGNPVFSIVAYDMIYSGFDLPSYLQAEFGIPNPYVPPPTPRDIFPWSRFVS